MPAVSSAADKVLKILNVIAAANYVSGVSQVEIARTTGYSASDVSRYVAALLANEQTEELPETRHLRLSRRLARHAMRYLGNIDNEIDRLNAMKLNLTGAQHV